MPSVPTRPVLLFAVAVTALVIPAFAASESSTTPTIFDHHYGPGEHSAFPAAAPVQFILAGEPSIGINWNTGAVFYQHGFDTYRVSFDDAAGDSTWTEVTPPVSQFNVDPLLYTDSETGRTYAGGLDGSCSVMAFTDDDGATWLPTGNACVTTFDHQSIVSGPWSTSASVPASLALHPRAVYYCAQAAIVTCVTSLDGGITFTQPELVTCGFVDPGFHGSLHISPQGVVYLPFRNCGGKAGVAVSTDNGQTWLARPITGTTTPAMGFDPDVATTTSGWTYIGFQGGDGKPYVSLTKNKGQTWSTPVNVGASLGIRTTAFTEMVAGDDQRAALAFLGTTTPGNAFQQNFQGVWHLYVATTLDGGTTWSAQQLSDDPVQRGWICAGGTGCGSGRNLLDFMDAQLDEEGRILIAYVDGCVDECAGPSGTPSQSTSAVAVVTRQSTGTTLFAEYD